jgi:hypothetical protein
MLPGHRQAKNKMHNTEETITAYDQGATKTT